eukprot:616708-Rhodomonas_salina.2
MACMATTRTADTESLWHCAAALLFRDVKGASSSGGPIQYLSMFPGEDEDLYVYLALTLLAIDRPEKTAHVGQSRRCSASLFVAPRVGAEV